MSLLIVQFQLVTTVLAVVQQSTTHNVNQHPISSTVHHNKMTMKPQNHRNYRNGVFAPLAPVTPTVSASSANCSLMNRCTRSEIDPSAIHNFLSGILLIRIGHKPSVVSKSGVIIVSKYCKVDSLYFCSLPIHKQHDATVALVASSFSMSGW